MSTEEEIKNLISFLTKRRIPLVYTSRKEKHPFEDKSAYWVTSVRPSPAPKNTLQA